MRLSHGENIDPNLTDVTHLVLQVRESECSHSILSTALGYHIDKDSFCLLEQVINDFRRKERRKVEFLEVERAAFPLGGL